MTADDYRFPDGSIDFERLERDVKAADIPPEVWKETAAKLARIYGKSMDDILIEHIRSGELDDAEKAQAMKMLGDMPLSRWSDATN